MAGHARFVLGSFGKWFMKGEATGGWKVRRSEGAERLREGRRGEGRQGGEGVSVRG